MEGKKVAEKIYWNSRQRILLVVERIANLRMGSETPSSKP
jgi:hypothetical protein